MWTQTERMKVSTAVIGKMKMMRNGESWRDSWVERNADDEQDDVRAFYAAPHHRLRGKRKRKTLLNKGKSKKSSMWSKVWTKDKKDGCLIVSVSMVTAKALVKHGERHQPRVVRVMERSGMGGKGDSLQSYSMA